MNCIGTSEEDYTTVREKRKTAYFVVAGKPQGKARARTFYNPKLGRVQSMTPENTVLYENQIKQCTVFGTLNLFSKTKPTIITVGVICYFIFITSPL